MELSIKNHFPVSTVQRFIRELDKNEKKETYLAASGLCFSAREIALSVITLGIYAVYKALESTDKVKEAVDFVDAILSVNLAEMETQHKLKSETEQLFENTTFKLSEHTFVLSQGFSNDTTPIVRIQNEKYYTEENPGEILCQGTTLLALLRKIREDALEHQELHKKLGGQFDFATLSDTNPNSGETS